jgi:hypothetical protein
MCRLLVQVAVSCAVWAGALHGITETERIHNDRVSAFEYELAPGEAVALDSRPAVTVYFNDGKVAQADEFRSKDADVQRGEAVFSPAGAVTIRNAGSAALHFARVEFRGAGNHEVWKNAGLAPKYKLLFENSYARVYDIRIPAGAKEPQHTHHDRVVICLAGARLEHVLPDGQSETATLETNEIAWRKAATHVGHNIGDTDLWVVAVEPK